MLYKMVMISPKPWTVAFFFFFFSVITGFVRYKCEFAQGCVQLLQAIWIHRICLLGFEGQMTVSFERWLLLSCHLSPA